MQPSLVLFPTFGTLNEAETTWTIHIHGALYEPRQIKLRRKILIRWLRQAVGTADADFDSSILDDRLRDFIAATRRGQRVLVQAGSRQLELTTQRNGHFSSQVCLPASEVARLLEENSQYRTCITIEAKNEACDVIRGRVHLVPRGHVGDL